MSLFLILRSIEYRRIHHDKCENEWAEPALFTLFTLTNLRYDIVRDMRGAPLSCLALRFCESALFVQHVGCATMAKQSINRLPISRFIPRYRVTLVSKGGHTAPYSLLRVPLLQPTRCAYALPGLIVSSSWSVVLMPRTSLSA